MDQKDKNNILLRVTQINAVYLDTEIVKCLEEVLHDAVKYLPHRFTAAVDAELRLLIKVAVIYYSVTQSGSTFGQNLLSIKYKNLSSIKTVFYFLSGFLSYFKYRLEHLSVKFGLSDTLFKINVFYKISDLLNLTWFLLNGKKPRIIERVLALDQEYTYGTAQRKFHSKYLERELLWNGFIEVLVYILPLINYHKLKRRLKSINLLFAKSSPVYGQAVSQLTLDSKCAYCKETAVLPHQMGCFHLFCYVCLKGNQMADDKFQCPLCDYSSIKKLCKQVVAIR